MRLRLKGTNGKQHTCSLPASAMLSDLVSEAASAFSLEPAHVEVLLGFPPAPCLNALHSPLSVLAKDGDSVIVRGRERMTAGEPAERDLDPEPAAVAAMAAAAAAASASTLDDLPLASEPSQAQAASVPEWACKVCTLENAAGISACEACGAPNPSVSVATSSTAPTETFVGSTFVAPMAKMASAASSSGGPAQSELLPAFDRAIKSAEAHAKMIPDDKHRVWALRKAKAAVVASLSRGDNMSINVLHTLPGVGHWVVSEVKAHLDENVNNDGVPLAKRSRQEIQLAPAATPQSFSWWYVSRCGERVEDREEAETSGRGANRQFRVCVLHSSGRIEKAFLPLSKAQLHSPAGAT